MNHCLYIAFLIVGITLNSNVRAQNLVPNPGFELVSTCNVTTLQQGLSAVDEWFTYDYNDNSPDIFNTCFAPPFNPPGTLVGNSMPHFGDAMAGVAYYPTPDRIEAISVALTDTLLMDSAYCVSFFVKNAFYQDVVYWSTNLGAFFSSNIIDHSAIRNNAPHISFSDPITVNEWVEISGYYIATGDERYLNIGFFARYPSYFHPLPYPDDFIYYFVDDISVIPCNKDSLLAVILELPNVFTPNGDNVNDTFGIDSHNIESMDVQILNRWGNTVARYDGLTSGWNGMDQNGDPVSDGVYFVHVTAETAFGEMLNKQGFVHLYRHGQ